MGKQYDWGKHKAEKREKMREEGRERGSKICCS